MAAIDSGLDGDILDKMIEVRRAIHQFPELSNREAETSAVVRRELEAAGIGPIREVAGTGLVVDIAGDAKDGRTLAIRADLDALPIGERTGLPFASRNDGVMHACGHDSHTAMVLAAALSLARAPGGLGGTARFIFQPAEEAEPLGGRAVVAGGHLDGVDGVIGIHVDPAIEAGRIGELQTIASRNRDPSEPLVITLGTIEGGVIRNILADEVRLTGTIRAMSEAVRAMAHGRIRALADGVAAAYGARAEVAIREGEPVLVNDPEMVALINAAAADVAGPDCAFAAEPWTASDDFAFYSRVRPSVYFRLGVGNADKGCVHPLHHPEFQIDEDAMTLGASVLLRAARRFLAND